MTDRDETGGDVEALRPCISGRPHQPHDWPGFPPDLWHCPGVEQLTAWDLSLLAEAFGGAEPSPLLTSRVGRILAAHRPAPDAGTHTIHVTAKPVAEDVVWCDECEEWVTSGGPEGEPPDAGAEVAAAVPLSRAEATDLHWLIAVAIESGLPRGDMLNLAHRLSDRIAEYAGDTSTTDMWRARIGSAAPREAERGAPAIEVNCVETPHDRQFVGDDGTTYVDGLPYRAEHDGISAAATTPEGAEQMVHRMLERRKASGGTVVEGGGERG